VAILVVNGYDRRGQWGKYKQNDALKYPWLDLCLEQIERHSCGWSYQVFVFDNSHLVSHKQIERHFQNVTLMPTALVAALGRAANRVPLWHVGRLFERPHPKALDHLVLAVPDEYDFIVTLDTDSFPVHDDWLTALVGPCERGAAVSGVYRDEMAPEIRPFIHVSGLCTRLQELRSLDVSFSREMGQDVGQNITEEFDRSGRTIAPLKRSNALNFHFLIGGIYGNVIYHHGAGSRRPKFWTASDIEQNDRVSAVLRDAVFQNLDHLVAVLRGSEPNDFGIEPIGISAL
jgi:hypothetical protein